MSHESTPKQQIWMEGGGPSLAENGTRLVLPTKEFHPHSSEPGLTGRDRYSPGRTDLQGRSSLREDPAEWRTTAGRAREGFGFGSTGREKGSAAPGWIAARTKTGNLAGEDRAELDRETTGEGRQPSRWRYRCCIAAFFLLHVACWRLTHHQQTSNREAKTVFYSNFDVYIPFERQYNEILILIECTHLHISLYTRKYEITESGG